MSRVEWRRYWLLGAFEAWLCGALALGAVGLALWSGNLFAVLLYSLASARCVYWAVEQRSYVRELREYPPRSAARTVCLWLLTTAVMSIQPFAVGAPGWAYLVVAAVTGLFFVRLPDLRHVPERLGIR